MARHRINRISESGYLDPVWQPGCHAGCVELCFKLNLSLNLNKARRMCLDCSMTEDIRPTAEEFKVASPSSGSQAGGPAGRATARPGRAMPGTCQ